MRPLSRTAMASEHCVPAIIAPLPHSAPPSAMTPESALISSGFPGRQRWHYSPCTSPDQHRLGWGRDSPRCRTSGGQLRVPVSWAVCPAKQRVNGLNASGCYHSCRSDRGIELQVAALELLLRQAFSFNHAKHPDGTDEMVTGLQHCWQRMQPISNRALCFRRWLYVSALQIKLFRPGCVARGLCRQLRPGSA